MKFHTLALAAACLALGTAPGFAVGLNLGGSASVSLGGDSSASATLGAGAAGGESGLSLNANLGLTGSVSTGGTSGVAAATGEVSAADTLSADDELGRVVRLIEQSNWSASAFANVDGVANGTTYDVSGMVNADNQAALDLALSANADEIGELQAALAANASMNSWLEAQGTEASDVIAVGVAADGSLAVFTH
jgi:hypothetical protein